MIRPILGVAAALLLSAGPAVADGMPTKGIIKAAPVAAGPNWNGFYLGLGIGAGAVSHDVSGEEARKECKDWDWKWTHKGWVRYCDKYRYFTESFDNSDTGDIGLFGTVTLGYDRVLHSGWIGGVFADYDFGSNISGDISIPGYSFSLDHNYSWAAGLRLGRLITPSTLLYGAAGYTQADFDVGPFGSKTFEGYFIGAGLETFLRQNWTLKLEYRYSDFGSETVIDQHKVTAEIEPSMHTARVVLSYKFGHPHH